MDKAVDYRHFNSSQTEEQRRKSMVGNVGRRKRRKMKSKSKWNLNETMRIWKLNSEDYMNWISSLKTPSLKMKNHTPLSPNLPLNHSKWNNPHLSPITQNILTQDKSLTRSLSRPPVWSRTGKKIWNIHIWSINIWITVTHTHTCSESSSCVILQSRFPSDDGLKR